MKTLQLHLVFAGFAALGLCAPAFADEANEPSHEHQVVTLDQLPPAAQKTLKKETKGKQIDELFKETERGKTIYEAQFRDRGKEMEVRVDADGKLIERETINRHEKDDGRR